MSILKIYTYPDPILKQKAEPVNAFNDMLRQFIDDMAETMYSANGIGLAAPQVGKLIRLVVIDISSEKQPDELRVFINPRIVDRRGSIKYEEGCLSSPGINEEVKRSEWIAVEYQEKSGKEQRLEAAGLLAVVIQHELDHLDGITFIERISRLKRMLILREYNRMLAADRSA